MDYSPFTDEDEESNRAPMNLEIGAPEPMLEVQEAKERSLKLS